MGLSKLLKFTNPCLLPFFCILVRTNLVTAGAKRMICLRIIGSLPYCLVMVSTQFFPIFWCSLVTILSTRVDMDTLWKMLHKFTMEGFYLFILWPLLGHLSPFLQIWYLCFLLAQHFIIHSDNNVVSSSEISLPILWLFAFE